AAGARGIFRTTAAVGQCGAAGREPVLLWLERGPLYGDRAVLDRLQLARRTTARPGATALGKTPLAIAGRWRQPHAAGAFQVLLFRARQPERGDRGAAAGTAVAGGRHA